MASLDLIRRIAASGTHIDDTTLLSNITTSLELPVQSVNYQGGLLAHQIDHAERLLYVLRTRGSVADTSVAGRGKTYSGSYAVKGIGLPVLIFCPLAAVSNWTIVGNQWGLPIVTITNYEMARSTINDTHTKWYDQRKGPNNKATICPWITKEIISSKKTSHSSLMNEKLRIKFTWNLPYKCTIIFDEEHVGKNVNTQTFAFIKGAVLAAKKQGHKILLLSATPIEKKVNLKSIMYFLGLISSPDMPSVNTYFNQNIGSDDMPSVHNYLYAIYPGDKERTTGSISSMPEAEIPIHVTNDVKPVTYQMNEETTKKIADKNREILILRERLRERAYDGTLGSINANRRYIEAYKVEKAEELVLSGLDGTFAMQDQDGNPIQKGFKRIAIYVNYKSTLHQLHKILSEKIMRIKGKDQLLEPFISVLHGDQQRIDSDKATYNFNNGVSKILISTIRKGGVALSFHDIIGDLDENGNNETLVIIFPPTSATDTIQVLGRTFRTNVKSSVVQRIIFTLGDKVEESIRDGLDKKIKNMMNFTTGENAQFDLYELVDPSLIPKKE